jgi:hypothetical protein
MTDCHGRPMTAGVCKLSDCTVTRECHSHHHHLSATQAPAATIRVLTIGPLSFPLPPRHHHQDSRRVVSWQGVGVTKKRDFCDVAAWWGGGIFCASLLHLPSNLPFFSDSSANLATPSSYATSAVAESTALKPGHGSTKCDFTLHLLVWLRLGWCRRVGSSTVLLPAQDPLRVSDREVTIV